MVETAKAKSRRERDGFYDTYLKGKGIDIGCGRDPITPDCDHWDIMFGSPTAVDMGGVIDDFYDWVYSSHLLEHVVDPIKALRNWVRILRPGGYLIVAVPHRDLYEKKRLLPSRFNGDHKLFFLLDEDDPPHTWSFRRMVREAIGDQVEEVYAKVCDEGWESRGFDKHSGGEYQIEAVYQKR